MGIAGKSIFGLGPHVCLLDVAFGLSTARGSRAGSTRHIEREREREREIVPVILHTHTHAHKGTGRGWTKFVRHADCRPLVEPGYRGTRVWVGVSEREKRDRERLGATRDAAGVPV